MATVHCNVDNDRIPPDEWVKIEKRIQPGEFVTHGMLGPGEKLADLLAEDRATMQRLGITNKQLATALAYVNEAERNADPTDRACKIAVYPDEQPCGGRVCCGTPRGASCEYKMASVGYFGDQECPFINSQLNKCHNPPYGSSDVLVIDNGHGMRLQFSTLLIHMIAAHGFFEGRTLFHDKKSSISNPWRVDPEHAYNVLREIVDKVPSSGDMTVLAPYCL
jgi:hypothetical protein